MPVNLAKIATNTANLAIPMGEDTLNITYYPGRVTERMFTVLNQMNNLQKESEEAVMQAFEQAFSDFNSMLTSVLKSWDLYEDAEETIPFPINAKRFSEIALGVRMAVFSAIMGDIRPEAQAAQNGRAPH